jgi:hypothetical protein
MKVAAVIEIAVLLVSWGTVQADEQLRLKSPNAAVARQLEVLAESHDARERRETVAALNRAGDTAAVAGLATAAAYDPDREVRIAAGDAIARIRQFAAAEWHRNDRPEGRGRIFHEMYEVYLHRDPTPEEVHIAINAIKTGTPVAGVQASLLGDPEFYKLHGSRPGAWVVALYTEVLGRTPTAREAGYWLKELKGKDGDRGKTALDFLQGARDELAQRAKEQNPG